MYKFTLIVVLVAIAQLAAGQVSLIIYSTADENMASSADVTATISQPIDATGSYMPTPTISATATSSGVTPTAAATSTPVAAWGQWGAWTLGTCSNACGNGTTTRSRKRCKVNDVNFCENENVANYPCVGPCTTTSGNTTATPVAAWGQWSAWVGGACSNPCGNGTHTRTRQRCKVNDNKNCENKQEDNAFCVGTCGTNSTVIPTSGAPHTTTHSLPLVIALVFISFMQYFF
ncbi:Adhesion G protein-coupled receptor B3 [Trichoplax sp. H2]|nr:Adhesion G protein-coupled receptor B3 [Trichoplax sp. H2]|eukprot:RDD43338.1 Adhesion G protein-coupled receptor B3 [Trichoplax sp. H2]